MAGLPDGISSRNRDLAGPVASPLYRRLLLCCIAVLPVLALLNVFGQHPTTSTADTPAVRVDVTAPARLRSGLIFQVRVQVQARRTVHQLELVFDHGWWESMTLNALAPEPNEERSDNGQVAINYGELEAHRTLLCWIYFMVNPTNVGKRREDIEVRDGALPIAHIHRSLTIFP